MSADADSRVDEIAARLGGLLNLVGFPETPEERNDAEAEITADIGYLLAELRDRNEKLARVEALADDIAEGASHSLLNKVIARDLRAADTAANGCGNDSATPSGMSSTS